MSSMSALVFHRADVLELSPAGVHRKALGRRQLLHITEPAQSAEPGETPWSMRQGGL